MACFSCIFCGKNLPPFVIGELTVVGKMDGSRCMILPSHIKSVLKRYRLSKPELTGLDAPVF
jgi:hypothetical protein